MRGGVVILIRHEVEFQNMYTLSGARKSAIFVFLTAVTCRWLCSQSMKTLTRKLHGIYWIQSPVAWATSSPPRFRRCSKMWVFPVHHFRTVLRYNLYIRYIRFNFTVCISKPVKYVYVGLCFLTIVVIQHSVRPSVHSPVLTLHAIFF